MKRSERKKPRRLWLKIPVIIVILLVLGVGAYAFSVYNNAKNTVNEKMHDPVETIDTDLTKEKLKATEPLNVLLLGIDSEDDQRGRSDAIMVMQLDPKTDAITIVSIPRDTRTEIVGKGIDDKINHAYAFGGAEMSVATVENFLGIDIDYYVSINMDGLVELVDELGTITISNEVAWTDSKYDFPEGIVEMNGDKTMSYVRMRKKDPMGDFGRTHRQRKVIEGIINEGASVGSVPKFSGMMDILGTNMSTNMDFDDMKQLFSGYKDTRRNVSEYMIAGSGQKIDGIYYLIVPDEEVQKAHELLVSKE
ncbi:LCP family glycopolymer transferase [Pseudogracilibacillus sp. SO30301A]|uniref:LCP family glycopolymer transferase n=1 Tax=Pseudogracilibacillus sp. SO30301A TaxID=3098291 RepID=UPI00300E594C